MPVKQEFIHEPPTQKIEHSEDILRLLEDVRDSIIHIDSDFDGRDLKKVLQIIEGEEKYRVNGKISKELDLSQARDLIKFYRRYSEGGCQSCVNFGRETIDAQDATSGWYCRVSDPDYDRNAIGEPGCRYSGFSPKVRKYHDNPCGDHQAKFPKTLSQFL